MANKIIHKHSSVVTDGVPKLPEVNQLDYGEIAINYGANGETITIKNSNNNIVEFKPKEYFDVEFESVNSIINEIETAIEDSNYVTTIALTDLNDRLNSPATISVLGGVKIGDFVSASTDGTLSVKTGTTSNTVARGDHSHNNYSPTGHTHPELISKIGLINGGVVNLSSTGSVETIYSELSDGGSALCMIGDSNGDFPSLELNETRIKVNSKYTTDNPINYFFTSDDIGANVGDLLLINKVHYGILGDFCALKIIPLNDAKTPTDVYPGTNGIVTPSEKSDISKIGGIEWTANHVRDTYLPFITQGGWDQNMNECFESGVYPWCLTGRPSGSAEGTHYTLIVEKSSTPDGSGFYTCKQTCYGREGADLGKIYQRVLFVNNDGRVDWEGAGGWRRIDSCSYDVIEFDSSTTSINLEPNKFYYCSGEVSGLTITLANEISNMMSEYLIEFKVSSSIANNMPLSISSSVRWVNGLIPPFLPGKRYQISILRNNATYLEFEE